MALFVLSPASMEFLHEDLKGQLIEVLLHFGIEFENPYLNTYSPVEEAIEKLRDQMEFCLKSKKELNPIE